MGAATATAAVATVRTLVRIFMLGVSLAGSCGCGEVELSLALVLLPGTDRGDVRAVVGSAVGQTVLAEVVVAGLVLGLGGEIGVADGGRVDVIGPVALTRVAHPRREADRAQGRGDRDSIG